MPSISGHRDQGILEGYAAMGGNRCRYRGDGRRRGYRYSGLHEGPISGRGRLSRPRGKQSGPHHDSHPVRSADRTWLRNRSRTSANLRTGRTTASADLTGRMPQHDRESYDRGVDGKGCSRRRHLGERRADRCTVGGQQSDVPWARRAAKHPLRDDRSGHQPARCLSPLGRASLVMVGCEALDRRGIAGIRVVLRRRLVGDPRCAGRGDRVPVTRRGPVRGLACRSLGTRWHSASESPYLSMIKRVADDPVRSRLSTASACCPLRNGGSSYRCFKEVS
jgi:hypothetical protein